MLHPLRHAAAMTHQRDRAILETRFATGLRELLQVPAVAVYRLYHHYSHMLVGLTTRVDALGIHHEDDDLGWPADAEPLPKRPDLAAALNEEASNQPITSAAGEGLHTVQAIPRGRHSFGLVEIRHPQPLTEHQRETLGEMISLYANCLALLDYSEVDTLTGLLNRKTFDEKLIKILSCLNPIGDAARHDHLDTIPYRRSGHGEGKEHWLAVMDIDHFKRVNDTFGHAIGDEVLLLVASLMQKSFRGEDKLFRFGGEEFVVVLKPCTQTDAVTVFDRFRKVIESYPFPQVGTVTISTGFAHIGPGDTPSAVLDAADEALYYAKGHGRNQVRNYEQLLASGDLTRKEVSMEVDLF